MLAPANCSPSPPLLAGLAWLVALLVLACHPSRGPVTPLVPPVPRATTEPLPPPPPVSLTASDGTGLVLATLHARAVIDDPLALTELVLAFDNPRAETIEGRFELMLPPGARVTRFALEVQGTWREAEVVERQQARQAYETALYEGRDPALLERDSGNRFSARVFPIDPYGRKRVLVSYVEEHADPTAPWRFALGGLPALEALELQALVVDPSGATRRLERRVPAGQAPTADFVVPRDAPHDDGVRHGEQVTARIQPLAGVELADAPPLQRLTVLVDTSASRALDFDASLLTLARVLQALARRAGTAELTVLAFDQAVVPIYDGPLVGFGEGALTALHARRPLGASDLGLALRALEDGEHPRVLLVSDGFVSAGERSDAALRRQLVALAGAGVERLDALVLGRMHDEDRLRRLVAGPLPSAGVLLRPDLPPDGIATRLLQPTLEGVRLEVPGARWWSPTRLDGLQPDDHVLVYADLPADQPLRVQVSGPVHRDVDVPLRTTESPLHEQGWRQAQIEGLVQRLAALQDELESTRLRRHVIELSVRHRIVNDLTAFLVLESDEEYARFGLDRRALEDVLVVGRHGAEVMQRHVVAAPSPTEPGPSSPPPSPTTDSGAISGAVGHSETREPIPGAIVVLQCTCMEGPREAITNHRGLYVFRDVPPGQHTVRVLSGQADVTKTFSLPAGARFRANFSLDPDADFHRAIVVESRRSFGRRRKNRATDMRPGFGGGSEPDEPPSTTTPTGPPPIAHAPPVPMPEPPTLPEPGTLDTPPPDEPAEPEQTLVSRREPEPIQDHTVARQITTEEFRNIPVGASTSRDFTAAVETSATISRDSAGISLAGTTGAESVYSVEGASITSGAKPAPARVYMRRIELEGTNLSPRVARRYTRAPLEAVETCYYRALAIDPSLRGRLVVRLELRDGHVIDVGKHQQVGLEDAELLRCVDRALRELWLPSQASAFTQTLVFRPNDGPPDWYWYGPDPALLPAEPPFVAVQRALAETDASRAWTLATAWREQAPIDVLALVTLGQVARARGDLERAARAYGSIIDLHPSRAEMLRFAAAQLEALGDPAALELAIAAYREAVTQRPDHPTGHRNLALALLRLGDPQGAFEALEQALRQPYPPDRFAGVHRVLRDDLGIAATAWLHREPLRAATIRERLAALGVPLATAPSLRIALTWEADASDVDLHVVDARGDQAFSRDVVLDSGGELVADVSNGFGPECVTIPGPPAGYPYQLRVHYYARGPMGYGMGKVSVLHHDGEGGVHLDDRPFMVMEDDAWLELGSVTPPAGNHPAPRPVGSPLGTPP